MYILSLYELNYKKVLIIVPKQRVFLNFAFLMNTFILINILILIILLIIILIIIHIIFFILIIYFKGETGPLQMPLRAQRHSRGHASCHALPGLHFTNLILKAIVLLRHIVIIFNSLIVEKWFSPLKETIEVFKCHRHFFISLP